MSSIDAIRRVIAKRMEHGATPDSIRAWLCHLRDEIYRTPGPTREAVVRLLRETDRAARNQAEETAAVDSILVIELENYRCGHDLCRSDQNLKDLRAVTVAKIRALLGREAEL